METALAMEVTLLTLVLALARLLVDLQLLILQFISGPESEHRSNSTENESLRGVQNR